MGFVKNEWMEIEARGYGDLEGEVCVECMIDSDLKKFHRSNQFGLGACDFCNRENVLLAPAEIVQERIMESFGKHYCDVQYADVPYDGREGGYQVANRDAWSIIDDNLSGDVGDEFCRAVVDAMLDVNWCERDWEVLSPFDKLKIGWKEFCQIVRHSQRFSFAWTRGEVIGGHPDYTDPSSTLEALGNLVESYGLLQVVPAGTSLFRVRVDARQYFRSIDDIGVPQYIATNSSRLSPAGIPMFYCAEDFDTAVKETWDGQTPVKCSYGTFVAMKPLRVIDLANLPDVPGVWSDASRQAQGALRFIHDLANDFSKPIKRGTKEDLHYAPTQIVAEYLSKVRFNIPNEPMHGFVFRSSKTGRVNYAFNFVNNNDRLLGQSQDNYLQLVECSSGALTPAK